MPDREKYIEVLSKTAKTVKEYNEDAPIKISLECIEDILELLKEQDTVKHAINVLMENGWTMEEPIVRCKNCKYWNENLGEYCEKRNSYPGGNWFCADGKRRDDDA